MRVLEETGVGAGVIGSRSCVYVELAPFAPRTLCKKERP